MFMVLLRDGALDFPDLRRKILQRDGSLHGFRAGELHIPACKTEQRETQRSFDELWSMIRAAFPKARKTTGHKLNYQTMCPETKTNALYALPFPWSSSAIARTSATVPQALRKERRSKASSLAMPLTNTVVGSYSTCVGFDGFAKSGRFRISCLGKCQHRHLLERNTYSPETFRGPQQLKFGSSTEMNNYRNLLDATLEIQWVHRSKRETQWEKYPSNFAQTRSTCSWDSHSM